MPKLPRVIESFKLRSIQTIITFSFTLMTVLVVIAVSIMLYNKFTKTAEENAYLNIQQIIEQVNYHLELYVKGMQDIYEVVEQQINDTPDISSPVLREQLTTLLHTREDLVSVGLFTPEGKLVVDIPALEMRKNTMLEEQSWFESAHARPQKLSFSPPHIQNLYKGQYKWVVSLSRMIKYKDQGTIKEGILLVDVNFRTIDELSRKVSLGKRGYAYIIDDLGNIVYHPQQQLIYAGLKYDNIEATLEYAYGSYIDKPTGEPRYITIRTVEPINWKIVGVAYPDEIVTTKKDLNQFIFWFLVVVCAAVVVLAMFVSAKISQPLRRLEKSVQSVGQGDFSTPIHVSGAHEVVQLSKRFNFMLHRIRQLMDQIIHEQEAKRKSELDVLQSQINPHFLYNTLNSVVRLAEKGKKEEIVATITSLSKFFRISLSKGKNIITLEEELEHVRHYLIIQKIRFKNKFNYAIECEQEALSCMTLKLILQPIVENAIHHGIEKMSDEGFIRIAACIKEERLVIQVSDNGLGMSRQVMEQLLSGGIRSGGSGVGVKNVNERIRLYYGKAYGLRFESELEEGTTVTIMLPVEKNDDEQPDWGMS
ncbi:cache domain-containing sensor histidine kinase [Paenibacillus chibensis]|uniref:cache domain-containing sensor histidine kinase n=1 Tax=Paenibacillus chibensis TaxID=59846 RepID=UPI000FD8E122|nr:sensor histidine kinase [Paenibacillus chibensis]MEC0371634.1 sensor histidine kinase [Paenibacillus chibensis]